MATKTTVNVVAVLTPQPDGTTRYEFDLYGPGDEIKRQFIVDLPATPDGDTDVWVNDSFVYVGDTSEDGFATFTPA